MNMFMFSCLAIVCNDSLATLITLLGSFTVIVGSHLSLLTHLEAVPDNAAAINTG